MRGRPPSGAELMKGTSRPRRSAPEAAKATSVRADLRPYADRTLEEACIGRAESPDEIKVSSPRES